MQISVKTLMLGYAAIGVAAAVACNSPAQPPSTPPAAAVAQPNIKPAVQPEAGDPVWHYEGEEGPANWAKLSPKFGMCGSGQAQSPIDIVTTSVTQAATPMTLRVPPMELKIAHHAHVADAINNGHTVQINYAGADTLKLGDQSFALVQYHFHGPSEHTINGRHTPMEMHLVHKSASNTLAVIGVFIEAGARNAAFDPIWSNLPAQKGQETHYPAVMVDVDALLPAERAAYRYDGSLTTPPCSEGVKWVVLSTPIQLSAEQIRAFTQLIRDNNRPTRPLNGRTVSADVVALTPR